MQHDSFCHRRRSEQPRRRQYNHQRSQTHGFSPDKTKKIVSVNN
jgi:hypothetical protein